MGVVGRSGRPSGANFKGIHMSIVFNKFIDINSLSDKFILSSQNFSWPRKAPDVLFPGQDISWAHTALVGHDRILPSILSLITIEDGYFIIGDGYDGIILTSGLEAIKETAYFAYSVKKSNPDFMPIPCDIPLDQMEQVLDEVFIGFDGAWMNYFHWLCYTLTRSYFAAMTMSQKCQIVLPHYAAHVANPAGGSPRRLPLPERVWQESLDLSCLSARVCLLPPGIYRAKKIHTIWPQTDVPTDILYSDVMHRVFCEIRSKLKRQTGPLNKIFISRAGARDTRMDSLEEQSLVPELEKIGFRIVRLEDLNFIEQANLFYNAEIVVGPHGAGLTNIVFGPEDLRVIELNRKIAGDSGHLRPWFYMIASTRRQKYGFIDGTDKGFSTSAVLAGIETLLRA
jgi:hypothetical protein